MPLNQPDGYAGNSSQGPGEQEKVIGCDFDKTLATHNWPATPYNHRELGEPIPPMVEKVKQALASGHKVVIFTARVNSGNSYQEQMDATESYLLIAEWCKQVFGTVLPITNVKSKDMAEIWDDRARGVLPNEGLFTDEAFPPVTA